MPQQQVRERSGGGPAERGSGRDGKPAAAGGGAAGVESQLVELHTRVGRLETVSERAEDRWEKWRTAQVEMTQEQTGMKREMAGMKQETAGIRQEQAELRKEQMELRKEQTEMRKEMAVCFRRGDEKMNAGFQRADEKMDAGFQRIDEKFDAMGREIAAVLRKVDANREEARKALEQYAQQLTRRLEMAVLLILAAILGTGIFG